MNAYQEPKYEIKGGKLVNRQSGEAIPDDEPVFILRARDVHAAGAIMNYATMVKNREHKEAANMRAAQFNNWRSLHHDRMKEPDSDMDSGWTSSGNPGEFRT